MYSFSKDLKYPFLTDIYLRSKYFNKMNDRESARICSNPRYFSYFIDFVLSLNNSTCVKSFSPGLLAKFLS